jgi:hypothetical protein
MTTKQQAQSSNQGEERLSQAKDLQEPTENLHHCDENQKMEPHTI